MSINYELEKITDENFVYVYKREDRTIFELMQITTPGDPLGFISIYYSLFKDEYYIQEATPGGQENGTVLSILPANLNLRFQDIFDYILAMPYFQELPFKNDHHIFELSQYYIDGLNITTADFLMLPLKDIQISQGTISVLAPQI